MTLDKDIAVISQRLSSSEDNIRTLFEDIKEIKDDLLKRPSWTTLAIITVLSNATIGLLVALVNKA